MSVSYLVWCFTFLCEILIVREPSVHEILIGVTFKNILAYDALVKEQANLYLIYN